MRWAEWRVVLLSSIGGGLEFYDFIIYGVFASYIGRSFFPSADPLASLVSTFAVFASGFLVRPIGGIVLGHFGDRFGRRRVFLLSLLLISAATIGMGLMPSYAWAGIAAPVGFVLLRLIQGFCLGGEIAGAVTYIVEAAPRRPGFCCSVLFCLAGMGVVLATGVSAGLNAILPADAMATYGWRVAFLLGGLLGWVGYLVRGQLEESPDFERLRRHAPRVALREVLAGHLPQVAIGFGIIAPIGALNGLLFVQAPAQLIRSLNFPAPTVANAVMISVTVLSAVVLVVGALSDIVPRRHLFRTGAIIFALGGVWGYKALVASVSSTLPVFVLAGLFGALMNGTFGAIAADLFPTRVRFTGVAVCYNTSMAIFQGLTPLAATLLIQQTGNNAAPGFWVAGVAALGVAASLFLPRYEGHIRRIQPVETVEPGLRRTAGVVAQGVAS